MLHKLMKTGEDWSSLILRLTLGVVMVPHGAQKLFGWFGGGGVSGTAGFFESVGIPGALVYLVILAEFFGGLALIVGLLSRVWAVAIAAVMMGAIFTVHASNGFFMNWFGNQTGEGFEFHLVAIAIALALAIRGSGALSVDRALAQRSASA